MDEDELERERWDQHYRAAVSESFCPYHCTPLEPWVHDPAASRLWPPGTPPSPAAETWLACLACGVSRIPRPGSETGVGMISCVPGLPCACELFWMSPPVPRDRYV